MVCTFETLDYLISQRLNLQGIREFKMFIVQYIRLSRQVFIINVNMKQMGLV